MAAEGLERGEVSSARSYIHYLERVLISRSPEIFAFFAASFLLASVCIVAEMSSKAVAPRWHADSDHYNGLPDLLDRFEVGEVWVPLSFEGPFR